MLYNPTINYAARYTVEYEGLFGESAIVCMWDANHNHYDYGDIAVVSTMGMCQPQSAYPVGNQSCMEGFPS